MFFRGSRYRNLPETVTLNAQGEWGRGKNLRLRIFGRQLVAFI